MAFIVAAKLQNDIIAVVSRGGRPNLAEEDLHRVAAPTLVLVGGLDTEVIELNRLAMDQMTNKKELVIIPGATHLFEEPSTIEKVERSLLTDSYVTCTRPPYSPLGCLIILKSA